jgi:hypothetical protein
MRAVNLILLFTATASAFSPSPQVRVSHPLRMANTLPDNNDDWWKQTTAAATAAVLPVLLASAPAQAAGPDWGIFEGKTLSLLHPVMMGSLLLFSLSTALLGFQWRRQRTLGSEISALQKELPKGLTSVSSIQDAMKITEEPAFSSAQLAAAMPIATQVEELQAERKTLAAAGPKDQHFSQGALLAFLGTAFAIEVRMVVLFFSNNLSLFF